VNIETVLTHAEYDRDKWKKNRQGEQSKIRREEIRRPVGRSCAFGDRNRAREQTLA